MRRVTVAIDVDGVIADFVGQMRSELGLPGDWQPAQWDIAKDPVVRLRWGKNANACVSGILLRHGFAFDIPPYEDEVDALEAIMTRHAQRADFVFVTSPMNSNRTWTHDREAWLHDQGFGDVPVIHTHRKDLVDADVLLDDKPEHVESFMARKGARHGLLRTRPWNESAPQIKSPYSFRVENMAWFGAWLDEVLT